MNLESQLSLLWESVRGPPSERALSCFHGAGSLSPSQALEVYRTAYWVRQVGCLAELFPRLESMLGADAFSRVAAQYIRAHPSRVHDLESLGAGFVAFLQGAARDVALVERARFLAVVALDEVPVTQPIAVETEFAVARHVSLVDVSSDEARIALGYTGRSDQALPRTLAIWRQRYEVFERWVEEDEVRCVEVARNTATLAALCEAFVGSSVEGKETVDDESAAARVIPVVRAWLERDWLVVPCVR
jgi:hypothetical protein